MFIKITIDTQREIVESLVEEIWTEYCVPMMGKEQVAYMLGGFQSRLAISEQIKRSAL
jgi:hypothetical protein